MWCRPEVMHFWQSNELAEKTESVVINRLPLIHLREVVKKSKWKFKMAFAIRGPTPPPTVDKKGGVGATTLSLLSSRYC